MCKVMTIMTQNCSITLVLPFVVIPSPPQLPVNPWFLLHPYILYYHILVNKKPKLREFKQLAQGKGLIGD